MSASPQPLNESQERILRQIAFLVVAKSLAELANDSVDVNHEFPRNVIGKWC